MAGLTSHPSAEPDTLVVRVDPDERGWLLEDAPDTYYMADYHRPHPVVLVRLSRIDEDALRDLLATARRVTLRKAGRPIGRLRAPSYGNIHNVKDDTSLTKIRLPEIVGCVHVSLSATL